MTTEPGNGSDPSDDDRWLRAREEMLRQVAAEVRDTARETGIPHLSPAVSEALRTVPRHEFVPHAWRAYAYENRALPIEHDQTISQPYIVAIMTEALNVAPEHCVLEIGTGSGYQAAVLAQLCREVHSVELDERLAATAAARLSRLAYHNVHVHTGDGNAGWPSAAPYDRIMVTAAAGAFPAQLLDQLGSNGRILAPTGPRGGVQWLELVVLENGQVRRSDRLLPVSFVPLRDAGELR